MGCMPKNGQCYPEPSWWTLGGGEWLVLIGTGKFDRSSSSQYLVAFLRSYVFLLGSRMYVKYMMMDDICLGCMDVCAITDKQTAVLM